MDFQNESQTKQFFETIGDFDHLVVTAAGGGSSSGRFDAMQIDVAREEFDSKFWGQWMAVQSCLVSVKGRRG